jgi:hypothetical protein
MKSCDDSLISRMCVLNEEIVASKELRNIWYKDDFLPSQDIETSSGLAKTNSDYVDHGAQSNESMFTCKIICGYLEGHWSTNGPHTNNKDLGGSF